MLKAAVAGILVSFAVASAAFAQACPTYTYTFTNGSTADANQVNSNFNSILNCANTLLAPLASPHFTGIVYFGPYAPGQTQGIIRQTGGATSYNFQDNGLNNQFTIDSVNHGLVVGTAWAATFPAPPNGAIIEGSVGIGTTSPSYTLHVNGTAFALGAAGALSDIRHKDRVETLKNGALEIVGKLRPVTYVWKEPKDDGMKGEQIGFVAQEVQKVLPSVVLTEKNAEKTLGLKYTEIIPVLTKAIQEQQAEIEALKAQLAALKAAH